MIAVIRDFWRHWRAVSERVLRDRLFWLALVLAAGVAAMAAGLSGAAPSVAWVWQEPQWFLWMVLLFPVLEELVFRGAIQGGLLRLPAMRRAWLGLTGANGLTSILFVLMHLVYNPVWHALSVFVPSLVFGWFRDRHRSVLPAILLHVLFNLMWFVAWGQNL